MPDTRVAIPVDREKGEIPIVILQYENGFTAYSLEVDGVASQGYSLGDAIKNFKKAFSLHISAFGRDVLPPMSERAMKVFLANVRLGD